jgi:hypothetical protein
MPWCYRAESKYPASLKSRSFQVRRQFAKLIMVGKEEDFVGNSDEHACNRAPGKW